jgi:hypothetical protein
MSMSEIQSINKWIKNKYKGKPKGKLNEIIEYYKLSYLTNPVYVNRKLLKRIIYNPNLRVEMLKDIVVTIPIQKFNTYVLPRDEHGLKILIYLIKKYNFPIIRYYIQITYCIDNMLSDEYTELEIIQLLDQIDYNFFSNNINYKSYDMIKYRNSLADKYITSTSYSCNVSIIQYIMNEKAYDFKKFTINQYLCLLNHQSNYINYNIDFIKHVVDLIDKDFIYINNNSNQIIDFVINYHIRFPFLIDHMRLWINAIDTYSCICTMNRLISFDINISLLYKVILKKDQILSMIDNSSDEIIKKSVDYYINYRHSQIIISPEKWFKFNNHKDDNIIEYITNIKSGFILYKNGELKIDIPYDPFWKNCCS